MKGADAIPFRMFVEYIGSWCMYISFRYSDTPFRLITLGYISKYTCFAEKLERGRGKRRKKGASPPPSLIFSAFAVATVRYEKRFNYWCKLGLTTCISHVPSLASLRSERYG